MIAQLAQKLRASWQRLLTALACLLVLPGALTSCALLGGGDTLHVLAGSEVKDLEPILDDMARETGVKIEFEYVGTLDGTEMLLNTPDNEWDAIWFPSNRYLSLFPEGANAVEASESIMRSPVVLGVRQDVAKRLGWSDDSQPSWGDVVDAVDRGDLTYGMTSPISSNSGFTTLVQLATAISGTGTVLEPGDVERVIPDLKKFASGQQLASGSSGWLVEKYLEDPQAVDGIFNYESVLRGVKVDNKPLHIVHPSDGVITSDYPLALLKGADDDTREKYNKVVEYLLSDEVQQRITEQTNRYTSYTPEGRSPAAVYELPFPNQLGTVQDLLAGWLSEAKKPSNMVFAIDTSGSMSGGDRMAELRQALDVLSGPDSEAGSSASFLRLQSRETITYLEFSHEIKSELTVTIPEDDAGRQAKLDEIRSHTNRFQAYGGTAMYDAVRRAYEDMDYSNSDQLNSIVLFTDGENVEGMQDRDFTRWYESFIKDHPEAKNVPVFTVHFGDSNREELESLSQLTGGKTFDGTGDSLATAFREIRGYL